MATLQQGYLFDGRYKLLKKLGEGGFSEVWLVEDTSAQLTLVLKVFLPTAQLDESGIEIFRNEFALVYNLNHPNLLKYTYFGVCVGHPYLVMPFYNNGSAEDMLGNCSERKAWQFLHDVAGGLACLHEHQPPIIHQDIKPANVLLDGNSFIITDFGISSNVRHLLGQSAEGKSTVQGTRPYMPPEKFQGGTIPLVASDIWALGASLYELLTGHLPFGGKGGEAQFEESEIPALPGNFSDDLKEVVTQCLSYQPANRPFAADLEQFAADKIAFFTTGNVRSATGNVKLSSIHVSGSQQPAPPPAPPTPSGAKSRKGLAIGAAAAILIAATALGLVWGLSAKKRHDKTATPYETSLAYYRQATRLYRQGVNNTQGQLDRFGKAVILLDSARLNPEFSTSDYSDSIQQLRGQIYDYCLNEAKNNYSSAFYDNELRKYVMSYLDMAKSITNTGEVQTLIDSIQYRYVE